MTLEQITEAYEAALIAERVARITAQHAELELQDATAKADRARRAYCEATLNPEQVAFRAWQAKRARYGS